MAKIVADSSCDIKTLEGVDFQSVPLTIYTDYIQFTDDENMDIHNMLDVMEKHKGRSYTSCPAVDAWLQAFGDADELFVVTITSGMSGTFNSAQTAAQMYLENHPDAKIKVIDSKTTGAHMALILEKIASLCKAGESFDSICQKTEEYMKKAKLFCALLSLHNLAQNGRISKVVASAAGVLGINVIGANSEKGTLDAIAKARGEKKLVAKIVSLMNEAGYKGGKVRMCHVENEGLAGKIAGLIRDSYPNADIKYYPAGGLCSYYAERGGIILGYETN